MKIKDIKEIFGLDDINLQFAVRKVKENGKTKYVSDVEITTRDWEKSCLENVSLRDALYHLGQAVLSAEDMECVDKYIYEYNKIYLAKRGTILGLENPGYLSYCIPRKNSDAKPEFQVHTCDGYRRYETFDELYKDAKENTANRTFESAITSAMFER